jgi:hypothetical protein
MRKSGARLPFHASHRGIRVLPAIHFQRSENPHKFLQTIRATKTITNSTPLNRPQSSP